MTKYAELSDRADEELLRADDDYALAQRWAVATDFDRANFFLLRAVFHETRAHRLLAELEARRSE